MKKTSTFLVLLVCFCCAFGLNAQTKSEKRGAAMSNLRAADFEALQPGMSWFYDWGNTPGGGINVADIDKHNINYYPMQWSDGLNPTNIRNYVKAHPNCKYILFLNEPNFTNQANKTPAQAAALWPATKALADELGLKVIAPACNYSSWALYSSPKKWLDEFFKLVDKDEFAGIGLHCYMGWSSALIGFVKEYIGYYNKPIWLTEFCSWDNRQGTATAEMKKIQREYLVDTFDFLETEPMAGPYAWFMAKTGENNAVPAFPWMQLLNGHNGILTENGKIFNNMSSYDDNFYHDTKSRIQANHYIRMKGIYMEETNDVDGIINVYDFSKDDYLEYNVEVPTTGDYHLFLRYLCASGTKVNVKSGTTTLTDLTLGASGTVWTTKKYTVRLNAGKQKIRFTCSEGNNIRFNWMNITTDASAETEGSTTPVEPVDIGTNLALNKPVEASSEQEYGNRLASFAVDGVKEMSTAANRWATEWEGAAIDNNRWFLVDLEEGCTIKQISIYWEAAYATAYYIEISSDKQNWTTIHNTTAGKGSIEEIPVSGYGRYVRFKCVTRATDYGVSFFEFEVYGFKGMASFEPTNVESISLYPNPVENTLYTENISSDMQMVISDINGRNLFEGKGAEQIDMSSYLPGVYFLTVKNKSGSKTFRLIKK